MGLRNPNSLTIIKKIINSYPLQKIIIMDLAPVQADIMQYVNNGAKGFILKNNSLNDLLITIRRVSMGATVLPPLSVDSLFSQIVAYSNDDIARKA